MWITLASAPLNSAVASVTRSNGITIGWNERVLDRSAARFPFRCRRQRSCESLLGAAGAISDPCHCDKTGGDMDSLQHARSSGGLHTDAGRGAHGDICNASLVVAKLGCS